MILPGASSTLSSMDAVGFNSFSFLQTFHYFHLAYWNSSSASQNLLNYQLTLLLVWHSLTEDFTFFKTFFDCSSFIMVTSSQVLHSPTNLSLYPWTWISLARIFRKKLLIIRSLINVIAYSNEHFVRYTRKYLIKLKFWQFMHYWFWRLNAFPV